MFELNEKQKAAVASACSHHMTIVNGGAGVGKTETTREIAFALEMKNGLNVELCAFAGKAAARLREATGRDAKTIHRLLGYNGKKFQVKSLKGKAVIIDEASMVPSSLLAEICRLNPARLILVGDDAQLPPVGIGQPFHDLMKNYKELITTLDICYRNKAAVNKAAIKIRGGECPIYNESYDGETYGVMLCRSPEMAHETVINMVKDGKIDFSAGSDIILTPRNGNEERSDVCAQGKSKRLKWNDPRYYEECMPGSVMALNKDIQQLVNPHPDQRFAAGDRVMVTKNNATLDIWNGTTATIEAVTDRNVYLKTDLPCHPQNQAGGNDEDNHRVTLNPDDANELVHAYAMTVHKSQGSQYRRVVFMPLNRDAYCLLDRKMIYTAVTRAKKECMIVGQEWAYRRGIVNDTVKRGCIPYLSGMGF